MILEASMATSSSHNVELTYNTSWIESAVSSLFDFLQLQITKNITAWKIARTRQILRTIPAWQMEDIGINPDNIEATLIDLRNKMDNSN